MKLFFISFTLRSGVKYLQGVAMGIWGLFFALSMSFANDCDFVIDRTQVPLSGTTVHSALCLEEYATQRDFANMSLGETELGKLYEFRDPTGIYFYDMMTFITPVTSLLGNDGRKSLVTRMYNAILSSLKNEFGACQLEMYSGDKKLSLNDFIKAARDAQGHPGTRLILTKDDVPSPRWLLQCPTQSGEVQVVKKGNYFFTFAEVYESNGDPKLKGNLAQYLLSFK